MDEKSYVVKVVCDNCKNQDLVEIPFRKPVSEVECSKCGCKKLVIV